MTARALAARWFLLQAAIVAAWWLVLWLWPAARAPFVVGSWPAATLLAFWLPDVIVLVGGSLAVFVGHRRHRPWTRSGALLTAGAALYAFLWCFGTVLVSGHGWLGFLLMAPCAAGSVAAALLLPEAP